MTNPMGIEALIVICASAAVCYSAANVLLDSILIKCRSSHSKQCKRFTLAYLKIVAKFRDGQVVALQSITSRVYFSIAYKSKYYENEKWTHIHHIDALGYIILHEDGTVSPVDTLYGYIKFWLPIDTEARCFMVLQGAKNFEF